MGIPCPKFRWIVAEEISVRHGLVTNFGKVVVTDLSNNVLEKLKAVRIWSVPSQEVWPLDKVAEKGWVK